MNSSIAVLLGAVFLGLIVSLAVVNVRHGEEREMWHDTVESRAKEIKHLKCRLDLQDRFMTCMKAQHDDTCRQIEVCYEGYYFFPDVCERYAP